MRRVATDEGARFYGKKIGETIGALPRVESAAQASDAPPGTLLRLNILGEDPVVLRKTRDGWRKIVGGKDVSESFDEALIQTLLDKSQAEYAEDNEIDESAEVDRLSKQIKTA